MATRIYYLRDNVNTRVQDDGTTTKGNPVVCIVSEFNGEDKKIKYNFAALYPGDRHTKKEDRFDKDLAKNIAIGRLNKKPIIVDVSNVPVKGFEINKLIISNLAERFQDRPFSRVRDAAQLWLTKSQKSQSEKAEAVEQ